MNEALENAFQNIEVFAKGTDSESKVIMADTHPKYTAPS
jgi:hypothetical protein